MVWIMMMDRSGLPFHVQSVYVKMEHPLATQYSALPLFVLR